MDILEKAKARLRQNFGGKKGTGAGPADTAAPSGIDLRPPVEKSVAGLSKNILIVGGAVAGLAVFGVWYGMSHVKPTMSETPAQKGFQLANAHNITTPAPYTPPKPAAVSSAPAVGSSAPASSSSAAVRASQAPSAAVSTQPTPQQQAVAQALSGNGAGGGSGWGTTGREQQRNPGIPESRPVALNTQPGGIGGAGQTAINPINSQSGLGVYDTHLVRKPASPFEVMQGSVIPATLTTGIESDLPGQITAVVARNVFDTASGASLLIPAGAQLVGSYANKVLPGQQSVAVVWNRIIFPNGSYINLGTMPGTDPDGMSGVSGDVDNHTWLMFKNALLLSLVGTGIQAATPQTTGTSLTTAQTFQSQLASTFGQAVSQVLEQYAHIAPTIKVQPGAQVAVVVSKDLVFPGPYTSRMQAPAQTVRDAAPPAMINPYPVAGGVQ